jgi:hypothetical protein
LSGLVTRTASERVEDSVAGGPPRPSAHNAAGSATRFGASHRSTSSSDSPFRRA